MTELEGHADRGDAGQIDVKPGPGRAGVERSEPGGRAGVPGTDVEIGGESPVLGP